MIIYLERVTCLENHISWDCPDENIRWFEAYDGDLPINTMLRYYTRGFYRTAPFFVTFCYNVSIPSPGKVEFDNNKLHLSINERGPVSDVFLSCCDSKACCLRISVGHLIEKLTPKDLRDILEKNHDYIYKRIPGAMPLMYVKEP